MNVAGTAVPAEHTTPDEPFQSPETAPPDTGRRRAGPLVITMTVLQALGFAATLLIAVTSGGFPPLVGPISVFLFFRVVANGARWFAGTHPAGLLVDGVARALSWTLGLFMFATDPQSAGHLAGGAAWLRAGAFGLGGLSLYGHHRRAYEISPRIGIAEATAGALVAAIAFPILVALIIPDPVTSIIVAVAAFVIAAALAAARVHRLVGALREGTRQPDRTGWSAWWNERFFLHVILLLVVVAWFVLRDTLRGIIPLFVLFEYSAGISLVAAFLLSLRAYLRKRLADSPITSPHKRHEQVVERQGEAGFDDLDRALGAFLHEGDTEPTAALASYLERRQVQGGKEALRPIVSYQAPQGIELVEPAWLYASRVLVFGLFGVAAATPFLRFLDGTEAVQVTLTILLIAIGLGIWSTQWNRFGGPWWGRPAAGIGGAALLVVADLSAGASTGAGGGVLIGNAPAWVVAMVFGLLFGLPLLPLAWRGTKNTQGTYTSSLVDPLLAIDRLREATERNLVQRLIWLGVLATIGFIVFSEMARFVPDIDVFFQVQLAVSAAFIISPVLLVMGLRLGRDTVERLNEREQAKRRQRYDAAMSGLEAVLQRHTGVVPATSTSPSGSAPPTRRRQTDAF